MRFLIIRPEPGASATAERVRARGGKAVVAPLFEIGSMAWEPSPAEAHDALMITSAHAVRQAGVALALYRGLPAYAVGAATAAVLREAGFDDVRVGPSDADALIDLAVADGRKRPLHLSGQDYRPLEAEGVTVTRRIVYGARAAGTLPGAALWISTGAIVLLHSPRAARVFAELWDATGRARGDVKIAAISAAAREAAGEGWAASIAAATPDDAALLAAAFALCEDAAKTDGRG